LVDEISDWLVFENFIKIETIVVMSEYQS